MVHLTISLETSVIIRFARVGQNCEVPAATHLFRPELRSACGNALGAPLYFFTEHLWGAHCVQGAPGSFWKRLGASGSLLDVLVCASTRTGTSTSTGTFIVIVCCGCNCYCVCVFSLQQMNEHCCANYTTIQLYPPNFQRLALLRCCDVVNSSAMIGKVPKCVSRTVCNVAESQHIKL